MAVMTAFLRAINVGGHVVKMEVLRGLFGELGLERVSTFIASGNVLFEQPATEPAQLEERIEAHLRAALGYPVATFVRSSAELTAAARRTPFADGSEPGNTVYCGFLKTEPGEAARERVLALGTPVDEFAIQGRELYWLCRIRISDSSISGGALEKALGMPATLRNMTTVRKLAALAGA